jgi:hypothetical protein
VSLSFDQIPDHDQAPAGVAPTTALAALAVPRSRRTVLRAAALGAMTLGLGALDWSGLSRPRAARAETGLYGLQGWDRNDCRDAYPTGYAEVGDTGGTYQNTYAACLGGTWRGSTYCEGGWHKYGTWQEGAVRADHVPISTACGTGTTKNAWRWTTPDGATWRCSDGFTTYWGGGYTGQTYLTICRARV